MTHIRRRMQTKHRRSEYQKRGNTCMKYYSVKTFFLNEKKIINYRRTEKRMNIFVFEGQRNEHSCPSDILPLIKFTAREQKMREKSRRCWR